MSCNPATIMVLRIDVSAKNKTVDPMILPKISAAILTMASHGSAYAIPDRQFCISFEQWVVMAGATNGAARVCGVERDDTNLHLMTARKNFTRFAEEHGLDLEEFDPLFERGIMEGETLTRRRTLTRDVSHETLRGAR